MEIKIKYRDIRPYKYQLTEEYMVATQIRPYVSADSDWVELKPNGLLYIRNGYCWDGPSGPTIDTKTFMRGSLVHDALYQLMREGLLDYSKRNAADRLLQRICIEDGMNRVRAWYVYHSVKLFAGRYAKPKK